MDDNTRILLEGLAEEMGVAVEVLWGALLRQAPIAGAMGLLGVLLFAAVTVIGLFLVCRALRSCEGDLDDLSRFGLLLAGAVLAVCFGAILLAEIPRVGIYLAGFLNPEYWALREVLTLLP